MCKQNLSFGAAIEALKQGSQVARQGWNGKNMYIFLNRGEVDRRSLEDAYQKPIPDEKLGQIGGIHLGLFNPEKPNCQTVMPHIVMRAADGSFVPGWLASQTDILATDWHVIIHHGENCQLADQATRV